MFSGSRKESRVHHISSSHPVEKRAMVAKVTANLWEHFEKKDVPFNMTDWIHGKEATQYC